MSIVKQRYISNLILRYWLYLPFGKARVTIKLTSRYDTGNIHVERVMNQDCPVPNPRRPIDRRCPVKPETLFCVILEDPGISTHPRGLYQLIHTSILGTLIGVNT